MMPAFSRCCGHEARMADAPCAIGIPRQPGEAIISLQRIAARFDEMQHLRQHLARQSGIRRGTVDLRQQVRLAKRAGAGEAHDVLRQHVQRAGAEDVRVQLARLHRIQRGARLEIFEAVARYDQRLARLVQPVVGAADALEQARRSLGRAHLDHEIDIAPVHPQIQAGGADERAQPPVGHRRLNLASRLLAQRSVVDADRQLLFVLLPQILEYQLGQAAGVAEDQRGAMRLDLLHHLRCCIAPRMAGPRHPPLRQHDRDLRLGPRIALHDRHRIDIAIGRQPAAIPVRIGDGGGERDAAHRRRQQRQPRHAQAQQIATLAGGEGVHLVDHDRLQVREQPGGIGVG